MRPEQSHVINPYKFDLEVKGQGHIRIMNVLDTSSHRVRSICQIWYANIKTKKLHVRHEDKIKAYKLDLEVKGQDHTEARNVQYILSHGDTPMCQIWYANVKVKTKVGET